MKKVFLLVGVPFFLIIAYFVIDSILFDGFKPERISENGFQGELFAQKEAKNQTAIVLLGGGDWAHYWGDQFVKQGHVALSLPFLGIAGNPKLPEAYPLEYFHNAISWLGKQPSVNEQKIIIMGASRNAELALLLASTYPDLIHGLLPMLPALLFGLIRLCLTAPMKFCLVTHSMEVQFLSFLWRKSKGLTHQQ